jgi:hypothetical protein
MTWSVSRNDGPALADVGHCILLMNQHEPTPTNHGQYPKSDEPSRTITNHANKLTRPTIDIQIVNEKSPTTNKPIFHAKTTDTKRQRANLKKLSRAL